MSHGRQADGREAARQAVRQLSLGHGREATTWLELTVRELSQEPALAHVYSRLLTSLRSLLEAEAATAGRSVRVPCPACGVAFLEAERAAHRRLTLLEACAHCDASLLELQHHVDGRTYPPDAREVPARARLEKLEEELEHIRHLAGLDHPTTVRWERTVAEAALARGYLDRARGLLSRAERASLTPDAAYAHLLEAIHDAARLG